MCYMPFHQREFHLLPCIGKHPPFFTCIVGRGICLACFACPCARHTKLTFQFHQHRIALHKMLESLCIDLINELFITKYKFLLAMKLNIMLSAKCQNCSKNKVAKDDQDGVSPSTVGNSTPVLHTQEEYNYANFCDLKRKEMRKQRIKKRNFKRLRKYVRDLKEHRAVDYSEGGNDEAQTCGATCLMKASQANTSHECAPHYGASHIYQPSLIILRSRKIRVGRKSVVLHLKERCILKKEKNSPCSEDGEGKKVPMTTPPMEKSRKKKKVDHHIRMLNNELCEYISKDFYPFLSLYNFDKEPLPPKKNRINTLLSKEKMNSVSRNRKKIKGTLRGEYTKGPVLLSSKKLNTHYVKFLSKVRMLIKRAYKGNSGGETTQTQGDDPKYTILKTLLYLKGGVSVTQPVALLVGLVVGGNWQRDPHTERIVPKIYYSWMGQVKDISTRCTERFPQFAF